MKPLKAFAAAILSSGLAACASSPVHYYTLQPPSEALHTTSVAPAPFLIDVLPVGIPAQLDQQLLVVRQADNGIAMLDSERWASSYGDEIRGALATQLTRQLGTTNVAGLPRSGETPVLRIRVQIRQFDIWPGKQFVLEADWSLAIAGHDKGEATSCHGYLTGPAPSGYSQIVGVQQEALQTLAARIAEDSRHLASSRSPGCTSSALTTPPLSDKDPRL